MHYVIICIGCNNGDLRISEGNYTNGTLEYCFNNRFGVVCGDNWDDRDAQVACRQLGYGASGKLKPVHS